MSIDRRFIANLRFAVKNICSSITPSKTNIGELYIIGENPSGDLANFPVNSIMLVGYKNSSRNFQLFYTPTGGECVFVEDTNSFYRFDTNNGWVSIITLADNNDGSDCVEVHTLTDDEVTAKNFTLSNSIASGEESNTICILECVAQVYNTDFDVYNNKISWFSQTTGLHNFDFQAGDTFIVLYRKANS